ncbi:MAG TPA: thioredoxin family protein [Gammaproteobacteria bacterium]|nr:thioredoxin family protein [Gammaproteobacteria bacterium]
MPKLRAASLFLILIAFGMGLARAETPQPYTDGAFEKLNAAGAPIIVFVHADWCPVCHVQKPIVDGFAGSKPYGGVNVLVVDFDKQKDVLRKFDVDRQSTLIAYRGGREVGRQVGITQKDLIEILFQRASGQGGG